MTRLSGVVTALTSASRAWPGRSASSCTSDSGVRLRRQKKDGSSSSPTAFSERNPVAASSWDSTPATPAACGAAAGPRRKFAPMDRNSRPIASPALTASAASPVAVPVPRTRTRSANSLRRGARRNEAERMRAYTLLVEPGGPFVEVRHGDHDLLALHVGLQRNRIAAALL